MEIGQLAEVLGPEIEGALHKKGYTTLTPIQEAVLAPDTAGQDLRITSQTGSGKTVAIGLILRALAPRRPLPRPLALVVVPTRELARQVQEELTWLYAGFGARIACLTGGSSYKLELRALSSEPVVVVGTPGRVVDHLDRGSLDPADVEAIVLDEADRMLEMGFREDLEKIFAKLPEGHRTHLASATFPREVERLANRVQKGPLHVEGTPLNSANVDIEHVVHLVLLHERFAALVNLLLEELDPRAIVFAKTRAEVAELSTELGRAGFKVATLSGELEQRERNRALAAFRDGDVSILVATDVAARGIDVAAVDRVIHFTAPTEPDAYTHRSGRTGRAGRRGTSHVLVAPRELARVRRVMEQARVSARLAPVPTQDAVLALRAERLYAELSSESEEAAPALEEHLMALASRLATSPDPARVIVRLLARSDVARLPAPREVTPVTPERRESRDERGRADRGHDRDRDRGRERGGERDVRGGRERDRERGGESRREGGGWVPFRVTWGAMHGADPRRLLAMVCRRGGIQSNAVGAIRIQPHFSVVDVAASEAAAFEEAAGQPDPRDRRVMIRPDRGPALPPRDRSPGPPSKGPREHRHERGPRPADRPLPPRDLTPARIPPDRISKPHVPADRASSSRIGGVGPNDHPKRRH